MLQHVPVAATTITECSLNVQAKTPRYETLSHSTQHYNPSQERVIWILPATQ